MNQEQIEEKYTDNRSDLTLTIDLRLDLKYYPGGVKGR